MGSRKPLQHMFEAVPPRYDLINCLFTFGMDRKWRKAAIRECLSSRPGKVLDLCCGTADMALGLVMTSDGNIEVLGLDYSQSMLERAVNKANVIHANAVSFIHGDASQIPLKDNSVDCVGISFAFRNLTYKNPLAQSHFKEVLRVLTKGGRYVIVESSQPKSRFIRLIFRVYVRYFVFWIGYLISGNRGAYRYLAESATNFSTSEEVKEMLVSAGFKRVDFYPQFFGAACMHVAIK